MSHLDPLPDMDDIVPAVYRRRIAPRICQRLELVSSLPEDRYMLPLKVEALSWVCEWLDGMLEMASAFPSCITPAVFDELKNERSRAYMMRERAQKMINEQEV